MVAKLISKGLTKDESEKAKASIRKAEVTQKRNQ